MLHAPSVDSVTLTVCTNYEALHYLTFCNIIYLQSMFFRYIEPLMGKIVTEVTCLIMFSHLSMSRGLEFACTRIYCVLKGETFFK